MLLFVFSLNSPFCVWGVYSQNKSYIYLVDLFFSIIAIYFSAT